MILLRRNHRRTQDVSSLHFIKMRIGRHELRRFKNNLTVTLERCPIGVRPVTKFRIEDRMRLLPDQERTDRRRTIAAFWSNHLGPARPSITLRSSTFARRRQDP